MTRTVDATLTAQLLTRSYAPFFRAYIRSTAGSTDTSVYSDVLSFELTATELRVKMKYTSSVAMADQYFICLRRGVTVSGTEYYLDTGNFEIITAAYRGDLTGYVGATVEFHANLFPRRRVTVNADDTYTNVITNYCTALGKTAVFKSSGSDFWGYQFMAAGVDLTLNNGEQFLSLLKQKYFIFACDNGNTDEILFYSAYNPPSDTIDETQITIEKPIHFLGVPNLNTKYVTMISVDEAGAEHYYVPDTLYTYLDEAPQYNIGYLETTDKYPGPNRDSGTQIKLANYSTNAIEPVSIFPVLTILQGDILKITGSNGSIGYIWDDHVEYLDQGKCPGWGITLKGAERIGNTEGGSLPTSLVRSAGYLPVNVSEFNGILNARDTNIQSALNTIDDHTHAAAAPAAHAASHQDGGSDETGYVTPGAFRLPKANAAGKLDGWISAADESTAGLISASDQAKLNDLGDYCIAYHNTTQSINDSTWTSLALNAETSDPNGWHDTSTNNERISIGESGLWLVAVVYTAFASNATGYRGILIKDSDGNAWAQVFVPAINGADTFIECTGIRNGGGTGKYVYAQAYQTSGGALNVQAYCKLVVVRIG